jgi:hypothetical protein
MYLVNGDLQILINGKSRAEAVEIDLAIAAEGLDEFKRHLLTEARLSPKKHEMYMLSYFYVNYTVWNEDESENSAVFMPIVRDEDMRNYILTTVKLSKKLSFRLEKTTFLDSALSGFDGAHLSSLKRQRVIVSKTRKAKNEIQFNSSGQVVRDKLQVLQERPYYNIYPIMSELEICAFCRGSS